MPPLNDYFQSVSEAVEFLKRNVAIKPKLLLVLSGGLGDFAKELKNTKSFKASDIPHFPRLRAEGHAGEVIFGDWGDLPIAVLKGRSHYYEGLSPQEVVFPYFVLAELRSVFVVTTNAVGGIHPGLRVGDIMAVTDQINMMGTNPLIGLSVQRPTNQFPSMQKAFDPALIALTEKVARRRKVKLKKGVFLGTPGPSYETPAEIRAFRKLGADAVGMSSVFEVIACRFLKMRVLTLNVITNLSADRHRGGMSHAEVLGAMKRAEKEVLKLLEGVVAEIAEL